MLNVIPANTWMNKITVKLVISDVKPVLLVDSVIPVNKISDFYPIVIAL